jgi:hypothetical protein
VWGGAFADCVAAREVAGTLSANAPARITAIVLCLLANIVIHLLAFGDRAVTDLHDKWSRK